MKFLRQAIYFFGALLLGGAQIFAASTKEQRAYDAAAANFQSQLWDRAEIGFAQFVQKFSKSTNAPMAVLLEAQAQFHQGKFAAAAALLEARKTQAGNLADQFANWTGEAQFAGSNYLAAAETFSALAQNFPNSNLRLSSTVNAAAAFAKLQRWADVENILEATNGIFQTAAQRDGGSDLILRGKLFLAQAKFELQDFRGAAGVLDSLKSQPLAPELDWQRMDWIFRLDAVSNDWESALADTTNLIFTARSAKNPSLTAESFSLRAEALERLGHPTEAAAAFANNLLEKVPAQWQRQAILNIAELSASLDNFSGAEQSLDNFLQQFPDVPDAGIARLTLGELHLKDFVAQPTATNHLAAAQLQFDLLLARPVNESLFGKALLDRGWCEWLAGKFSESLVDFQSAAQKNLSPEDWAIAQFKIGDALFQQGHFADALESYRRVPQISGDLARRAEYQILRASLELNDTADAREMFTRLFEQFSNGELGQGSALLYGQSIVNPAEARALFEKMAPNFSGSPLEPQLRLAIARTFEQEQNWTAAITNYQNWQRDFPTNNLRPQADFALAQANFHAGNETNALVLFGTFIAQNPTNALAPSAQWWIADHDFVAGEFVGAETNYEDIFQNTNAIWRASALIYPAQMMAGRAAMGRLGFKDATVYFTALMSDTNCPEDLRLKARFGAGAALMHMDSSDTNATLVNLQTATNIYAQIIAANPTNEFGARAWGEMGNCDSQLGDYFAATNAYAQVFAPESAADISARSEAQIGFGMVLEKMAAQVFGSDQTNLLNLALDNYLQVFHGANRRDSEMSDPYWLKKAGLQAAPLVGILYDPARQKFFYEKLEADLPQLKDAVDKKLAALPVEKN